MGTYNCQFLVLLSWLFAAHAFVPYSPAVRPQQQQRQSSSAVFSELLEGLPDLLKLPKLPNPFKALESFESAFDVPNSFIPDPSSEQEYDPSPSGLIRQAKRVVSSDLGLKDPSLLDDTRFQWIGPSVDQPLGKREYLAAGKFFDLRAAFPDLDYRAHDYRVDEEGESTVRLTCRVTGTMRGELRLRNEIRQPTGQKMICPPEAVSMTFDKETGKVIKLCTGFSMDRLVGNTGGTTGVMAAATIAGEEISDWEIYPPLACVQRFFGRPVRPLPETKAFLAPFPETVMIQLAKGILAAEMAADDPTLLSDGFTFCTPFVGPIKKDEFLEKYAREEFSGIDPSFSFFRVDPYDPVRVWVDVSPSAPGYEGAPQTMSFTIDDEGFCTRITSWAVMDPTVGNGGGLGGPEGYRYAAGQASPAITTRPLPRILGRLRKRTLEVFTGVGADDYVIPGLSSGVPAKPKDTAPLIAERLSSLRAVAAPALEAQQKQARAEAEKRIVEAQKRKAAAVAEREAKFERPKIEVPKPPKITVPKVPSPPKMSAESDSSIFSEVSLKQFLQPSQGAATVDKSQQQQKLADDRKRQEEQARKRQASVEAEKKKKEAEARAAIESKQKEAQERQARQQAEEKKRELERKQKEAQERQAAMAAEKQRQLEEAKARASAATQKQKELADQQRQQAEARAAAVEQARQEAEKQKQELERKRKETQERQAAMAAEKQRQQEEAKARASAAAQKQKELAEQKRQEAGARAAAVEQARQEAEQQKRALVEQRRKEAEKNQKDAQERQAAMAAERKRQLAEVERKKQEAAETRRLQQLAQQAEKEALAEEMRLKQVAAAEQKRKELETRKKALAKSKLEQVEVNKRAPAKIFTKAPRGVPTIVNWSRRRDGGITGRIYGSPNFNEGDRVETTPITAGDFENGCVVQTGSGSRYFLSKTVPEGTATPDKAALKDILSALPGGTITLTRARKEQDAKAAEKALRESKPGATFSLFGLGTPSVESTPASSPKPKPVDKLKQEKVAKAAAAAAIKAATERRVREKEALDRLSKASPGATIGLLFGLGGTSDGAGSGTLKVKPTTKLAPPPGVPTLTRWRKNSDGSITGNISGSPKFSQGQQVTTSPIASGKVGAGEVVRTGSGSRYFLS